MYEGELLLPGWMSRMMMQCCICLRIFADIVLISWELPGVCRIRTLKAKMVHLAKAEGAKTQRTPAFAHALILSALAGSDEPEAHGSLNNGSLPEARGGFTDVGRHTGSEKRQTCWPLVREVIKVRDVGIISLPASC